MKRTAEQGLRLYGVLGRAYGLVRRWDYARRAYEKMLATARKAEDHQAEWEALMRLATLASDFSFDPEADDDLFRGLKKKAEQEAAVEGSTVGGEGEPSAVSTTSGPEPFVWSPSYALKRGEEALRVAQEMNRDDLIAASLSATALIAGYTGRWRLTLEKNAESRSLYAAMGDRVWEAEFLNLHTWGEALVGSPRQAVRLGRERLAIVQELGDLDIYDADQHGLVLALLEVGEHEEALSLARRGAEAARSLGFPTRSYFSLALLGDACRTLYRLEEARSAYLEMDGAVGFAQFRAATYSKLCAVAALEGEWEEAHDHAVEAAGLRGDVVLQMNTPLLFHHEIEALLRGGNEDLACKELRRFAEAIGENRRFRIAYLRARAILERWENKMEVSVESLREAEFLAEEIGLPGELWQVRAELGELYEERGEREESDRCFSKAAEDLRELAAKIEDKEIRTSFLAAPQARLVLLKNT